MIIMIIIGTLMVLGLPAACVLMGGTTPEQRAAAERDRGLDLGRRIR